MAGATAVYALGVPVAKTLVAYNLMITLHSMLCFPQFRGSGDAQCMLGTLQQVVFGPRVGGDGAALISTVLASTVPMISEVPPGGSPPGPTWAALGDIPTSSSWG